MLCRMYCAIISQGKDMTYDVIGIRNIKMSTDSN